MHLRAEEGSKSLVISGKLVKLQRYDSAVDQSEGRQRLLRTSDTHENDRAVPIHEQRQEGRLRKMDENEDWSDSGAI